MLNLKLTKEEIEELKKTPQKIYEILCNNYDLMIICDEYCISNYATEAVYCYNGGSDYYEINSYDLWRLEEGDEITLEEIKDIDNNEYIQEFLEE